MFTQAMPAIIDALRQAVPPHALGPLAQSLGNCAQPLTHRAGVNFPGAARPNRNGTFGGGAWNPADYTNLFPGGDQYNSANYYNNVDVGGMTSVWNEGNRYDSQFYFPTSQFFTQNQYYGGPTIHVAGGQYVDYINNQYFEGDTVNVQNVTTNVLNGDPVAGPQGAPGVDGRDGERGAPGAPGISFRVLPPGRFRPIRYLTGRPKVAGVPEPVARPFTYFKDCFILERTLIQHPLNPIAGVTVTLQPEEAVVTVPTDAISGGTVSLSPTPVPVEIPLSISFNPDTCTVNIDSVTTVYVFPSEPSDLTISGTPAATQNVTVASTAMVTASVTTVSCNNIGVYAATTAGSTFRLSNSDSPPGFLIKGSDELTWNRAPAKVVVLRDPKVVDVHQLKARVYRQ